MQSYQRRAQQDFVSLSKANDIYTSLVQLRQKSCLVLGRYANKTFGGRELNNLISSARFLYALALLSSGACTHTQMEYNERQQNVVSKVWERKPMAKVAAGARPSQYLELGIVVVPQSVTE